MKWKLNLIQTISLLNKKLHEPSEIQLTKPVNIQAKIPMIFLILSQ